MDKPLVSIIIRTCGRPQILKNALESVRKQTYSQIETVVVEDGSNVSESFILSNFSDLKVRYYCSGEKKGRCFAGNFGLEMAKGVYCNFLDDDDYLLPNHVEVLVENILKKKVRAVYSIAEEHQIRKDAKDPSKFKVKRKLIRYKQPFNRLLLFYMNYIPIQSILFERSLYEQYGGIDEELELLEDWDLWVRYAMEDDFVFVPEVTSVYHTPYKGKGRSSRGAQMNKSEEQVKAKHAGYLCRLNVASANRDMDYILNVFNKKGFLFYMQKIRNFLLYKDI